MDGNFTESVVEEACLQYFGQLKCDCLPAPESTSAGPFTRLRQRQRAAGRTRCRAGL
jgi:hypothetical protein